LDKRQETLIGYPALSGFWCGHTFLFWEQVF
jgi:hypothetical protein